MLSRIAESLFWIGRYVERAEDTARILDVHVHRLLEDPWIDEDAGLPGPAGGDGRATGRGDRAGRGPDRRAEQLAFDRTSPSSIVGALSAARENARGAREAISSEMWECLNATWTRSPTQAPAARQRRPDDVLPLRAGAGRDHGRAWPTRP